MRECQLDAMHTFHFRSRGGGNEGENRVTVCAAHHLHGIHTGAIRAEGVAPRDVRWQLGVRSNAPPLLTYVGDRLCEDASSPPKAPLTEAQTGVYFIS